MKRNHNYKTKNLNFLVILSRNILKVYLWKLYLQIGLSKFPVEISKGFILAKYKKKKFLTL
jgi:hypothetical protein